MELQGLPRTLQLLTAGAFGTILPTAAHATLVPQNLVSLGSSQSVIDAVVRIGDDISTSHSTDPLSANPSASAQVGVPGARSVYGWANAAAQGTVNLSALPTGMRLQSRVSVFNGMNGAYNEAPDTMAFQSRAAANQEFVLSQTAQVTGRLETRANGDWVSYLGASRLERFSGTGWDLLADAGGGEGNHAAEFDMRLEAGRYRWAGLMTQEGFANAGDTVSGYSYGRPESTLTMDIRGVQPVPEPITLATLGVGAVALMFHRNRPA